MSEPLLGLQAQERLSPGSTRAVALEQSLSPAPQKTDPGSKGGPAEDGQEPPEVPF